MKGIRWFQRLMITLLLAVNAFVFMSMRDVAIEQNLIYTIALISSTLLFLTAISFLQKYRKKKTIQDSH
jgi:hypothetical protein